MDNLFNLDTAGGKIRSVLALLACGALCVQQYLLSQQLKSLSESVGDMYADSKVIDLSGDLSDVSIGDMTSLAVSTCQDSAYSMYDSGEYRVKSFFLGVDVTENIRDQIETKDHHIDRAIVACVDDALYNSQRSQDILSLCRAFEAVLKRDGIGNVNIQYADNGESTYCRVEARGPEALKEFRMLF